MMSSVYATDKDIKSELGKKLFFWRAERPDEWTMDEFIRDAERLHQQLSAYKEVVEAMTAELKVRRKPKAYIDEKHAAYMATEKALSKLKEME